MRGKDKAHLSKIGSKATIALNATDRLSERLNKIEGVAYTSAYILVTTGLVGMIITTLIDALRGRPFEMSYFQILGIVGFCGLMVIGVYLVSYLRKR